MRTDERILMGAVFVAYIAFEMWTLAESGRMLQPFPFSDQEISVASYIWIACLKFGPVVFLYVIQVYSDRAYSFFATVFWIQVAEIFEYFLNYNEPWFRLSTVPVNITTLRYVILFCVGSYSLYKWKT